MLRIGILGSDNSHAERFSEVLNLPEHPNFLADADAQVVAILGQEPNRTQQVVQQNRIPTIADCYRQGMKQILTVLRGGPSPVPPTDMIEAIQLGAAIELSLQEKRRVFLHEV